MLDIIAEIVNGIGGFLGDAIELVTGSIAGA